jgi:uncharacterized alpha-E superfamily protein
LSGRLLSELSFSSIEEIWARGLHEVMDELQLKLNELGAAILEVYMHPSVTLPTVSATGNATTTLPQVPQ